MWRCWAGHPMGERAGRSSLFPSWWTPLTSPASPSLPAIFDIGQAHYFNATYLRAMSRRNSPGWPSPISARASRIPPVQRPLKCAALLQARCEKADGNPREGGLFRCLPGYSVDFSTNKKSKTNPKSPGDAPGSLPVPEAPAGVDCPSTTLMNLVAQLEVKNATLMWPVDRRLASW